MHLLQTQWWFNGWRNFDGPRLHSQECWHHTHGGPKVQSCLHKDTVTELGLNLPYIVLLIKIKAPPAIYWHSWASVCVCVSSCSCPCHCKTPFTTQLPFRNTGWHFTHPHTCRLIRPRLPFVKTLASAPKAQRSSERALVFVRLSCSQNVTTCLCCVARSQNVPVQIPSTTGTRSDPDCMWYQISSVELFRQPYSKELMANNGLGNSAPSPTPSLHWQLLLIRKLLEPSRATKEGGRQAGSGWME